MLGIPFINALLAGVNAEFLKVVYPFFSRPRPEHLLIDSTVVRAHAYAAGAQSLGRSRGGFSIKIHLATDSLGNALRFISTGGERQDIRQAEKLIENFAAECMLADKVYDADALLLKLQEQKVKIIIPSKSNRKDPRAI